MNDWLLFRIAAATIVAGLALTGCSGSGGSPNASGTPPTAPGTSVPPLSHTPTPPRSPAPTADAPAGTRPPTTPAPLGTPPLGSWSLQPMWPFTTLAQAHAWQRAYRSGGRQPWHLDPEQTALSFTRGYLGFQEIGRVSSRTVSGRHARIGVARTASGGGVAAALHLVRYGTGPDAPWEVVGSDDTTFSLTRPAYGASVRSPMVTGGRITGVDESIRVQVRQPSSAAPLGTSPCCTAAGGTDEPWRVPVSFAGARDPVLTVVAATGGHVADVERFTVTAVRTR
ncbi:hypothetical protein [Streptomyces sp. MK7]|uniref:hypothetical protein n=1 Tax=Streptomyces sp. MK7 TaxID=3067635 RepID=UPI0029306C0F|nr:hypothetical protein [Streptomyces sp. MK7]